MGSRMDANGDTASLKKRKREQKDDALLSLKRLRSKSKSNSQVNGTPDKKDPQPNDSPAKDTDGDVELPDASLEASTELVRTSETERPAAWKVSKPMGGRMLDIDPIFSLDERRNLIITYNTSIQVYSTENSLLVRRIALPITRLDNGDEPTSAHIVASSLSKNSPDHIWVAFSDGRVWNINWATGGGADTPFMIDAKKIIDMAVESVEIGNIAQDVLLILKKLTYSSGQIVAYDNKALSKNEGHLLHTYDESPQLLRSTVGGRLIVAAAKEALHVGVLGSHKNKKHASLNDLAYHFHSFAAPDTITCLDVKPTVQTNKKGGKEIQCLDLVIGCARGAIYAYNDVLSKLPGGGYGSSSAKAIPFQPRKYHWHRRAVHSVKWSEDGKYFISGGYETVLVLWQIDTGKKDFLPHLSAAIENITISHQGSSYALHLDDNSAMVLSTAEMKPTMYVSGIQSLVLGEHPSKDAVVKRVWKAVEEISMPLVTASNPRNTSQMYLCVGNGQQATIGGGVPSTPLVQVFDIASFQSVSKHAIARTNPTEANITTQGVPIIEPRVTKLAFSRDGQWLASVDEWQPPARDAETFLTGSKTTADVCQERRETFLKFWEVGEDESSLELVSRINEAHHTTHSEAIFDLASDPTSSRFATIGSDGMVRFWTSKLRRRDGLASTGPEGQQLRAWSCSRTVSLPLHGQQADLIEISTKKARSGALTFSEDGSVLFAAFGASSEAVVVAIDTETGSSRDVVSGMFRGEVRGIKALSSCLIMLSDDLTVYDIVSDELQYSFGLKDTSEAAKRLTQLAVNYESRSFALVAPVPIPAQEKLTRGAKSELLVFSVDDSEPQLVQTFPQLITSVFPAPASSGFVVVDSKAQIWSVTEGSEQAPLLQPLADLGVDGDAGVAPLDVMQDGGEASDEEMEDAGMDVDMEEDYDIHTAVVAPQRLAEIFNAAPAFAMPPIEDIFNQVAGLFSTKPVKA
ncbi:WD40-repeat-containing domain protein [Podospora didyma]|uniref:WD40-repeat-containing domain protein n=1 Tax=Podospora didyma TaxID=330526 RepID=A0AAE0P5J7_9PEZI|nr:WD40-repeat-containing domain protein [Podospora didyma]